MEKVLRIFDSFEDADRADAAFDAKLTPEKRLQIVIDLRDLRYPDASKQGLARVSRVIELEAS